MNNALKKILIVDDEKDILDILKIVLTAEDFDVAVHSSAFDVEERVIIYQPDLIILDVMMPGLSGIEICKQIKKNYHAPIVFCSAHGKAAELSKECNADGFIPKPFDVPDFVKTVQSYFD